MPFPQKSHPRWLRLDNAAKIYPAARNEKWSNVFRMSATLRDEIDTAVLRRAWEVTIKRVPFLAARLRKGVFWYYLEPVTEVPIISEERSCPLAPMSKKETRRCAFRVIAYRRRIAIELFHSLTDGSGATIFLKTLTAEYLEQRYGVSIPAEAGVLDRRQSPVPVEWEDSFLKHAGTLAATRKDRTAYRLHGTPERSSFLRLTCFQLPASAVVEKAHQYGVSVTAFLCAAIMQAAARIQQDDTPELHRRKPIKVLLPVNLRPLFGSTTLRNFALYCKPEILPALGDYTFEEICAVVKAKLDSEVTAKQMSMQIAVNVRDERPLAIRVMPLFIKNMVMKAVYHSVGEKKACLCLSNLGAVTLPASMTPYVERMDFVLGVQATTPYNCGVLSFGDTLYLNMIRNIREPILEQQFHCVLQELGLTPTVESNEKE